MTGVWTIADLDVPAAERLSSELGVSDVTAAVLVRRGYGAVDDARRFLDSELPGHDPHLLGDIAEAVERIRAAIDAGTRICVHGDYDVDGICATALAVLLLRELGADVTWHLPSRFEEGYGVSTRQARTAGGGRGRARGHRRLRDHRGRRGRPGEGGRPRGRRDRPPPARRRAAGLPAGRRRDRRRTRSRSCAGRESCTSSARRSSARSIRSSGASSTSSPSRRSPTSCRSWTRIAPSPRPACARSRARDGRVCRRCSGVPGSIPRPWRRRRSGSGSRRGSTRLGGSAVRTSRSS